MYLYLYVHSIVCVCMCCINDYCFTYMYVLYSQAALIMQLLNLTDEQIRMLPADQRSSILALKEQVERTARH